MRPVKLLAVVLIIVSLASCKSYHAYQPENNLNNHIISIDRDGFALQPDTPSKKLSLSGSHEHAEHILTSIKKFSEGKDTVKFLFFIHGGLNSKDFAKNNSQKVVTAIKADDPSVYPICINWDSGLISSYGDHLLWKRNGHHVKFIGVPTAPVILAYDLLRGIIKSPITFFDQISSDLAAEINYNPFWEHSIVKHVEFSKNQGSKSKGKFKGISNPEYHEGRKGLLPFSADMLTYPVKFATGSFVDAIGTTSWDNMLASTQYMFNHAGEFIDYFENYGTADHTDSAKRGHVGMILDKLTKYISKNKDKNKKYEITIIGHSMGTIVTNELLVRYPELPYTNIVYMGAACTFNDFKKAVLPIMEKHKKCDFYSLSLSPKAERSEGLLANITPKGSLLVWLDNMFTRPATPMDRMIGRWENLMHCAQLIPNSLRSRVSLKVFPYKDVSYEGKYCPQEHGSFDDEVHGENAFWKQNNWRP